MFLLSIFDNVYGYCRTFYWVNVLEVSRPAAINQHQQWWNIWENVPRKFQPQCHKPFIIFKVNSMWLCQFVRQFTARFLSLEATSQETKSWYETYKTKASSILMVDTWQRPRFFLIYWALKDESSVQKKNEFSSFLDVTAHTHTPILSTDIVEYVYFP